MLDAYRRYFLAVLNDSSRVRSDVRALARSARTNAQASLDRLRGEPRRDAQLVALAEGIFANANRFIRAAMALEAARQGPVELPARGEASEFAAHIDADLARIAHCLRSAGTLHADGELRTRQRALAAAIAGAARSEVEHALAEAWIDASDRIADSVAAMEHLLLQARKGPRAES
jgi:hypothetical protein